MTTTSAHHDTPSLLHTTARTATLTELLCALERSACAKPKGPTPVPFTPTDGNLRFPAGFVFGAATSAHQVEGHCTDNDSWAWEQEGRVPLRLPMQTWRGEVVESFRSPTAE